MLYPYDQKHHVSFKSSDNVSKLPINEYWRVSSHKAVNTNLEPCSTVSFEGTSFVLNSGATGDIGFIGTAAQFLGRTGY